MPDYPGLGLPIRHDAWDSRTFPHGAEAEGVQGGTETELLYIRELAMMDMMEKLTDKPNWHKKIFDEKVVAKWRQEALDVPDQKLYDFTVMNENAVDCVSKLANLLCSLFSLTYSASVSKSFRPRPSTSKSRASFLL